uniref:Cystatin domain-containing protein n=1 Tax=Panagrolaimus sp. PS1159 TaxID=55785 RepID=A0AC35EYC2_9BILA
MFLRILLLTCFIVSLIEADMMAGGWTPQDKDSKDVKALVDKVVTKYNAESNDMYYHIPVEVISAESQVVAGVQYRIKLKVGKSTCLKNQVSATDFNAANCEVKDNDSHKEVTAKIWSKPWENFEEISFE